MNIDTQQWSEFETELEYCHFTGDAAIEKVLNLSDRVKTKRLTVVTRLLRGVRKLGGRVEFCHCDDLDDESPFEREGEEFADTRGLFTEDDSWIYLRTDKFKGWGYLEEVLAHEAVHFLQLVLRAEPRMPSGSNLSIYLDRCWAFDGTKYREWLEDQSEEDLPVFEVEAYCEQKRPRGVACALEYVRSNPKLWEGTWYTALE
jgi:hypothetical protein